MKIQAIVTSGKILHLDKKNYFLKILIIQFNYYELYMEEHLKTFVETWGKNKPGFPDDYCNPAASALQKILKDKYGIETKKAFSYTEPGVGHTFLLDDEGNILDPTYGQFDSEYEFGFFGKEFPDEELQNNIIEGEAYMELQKKRLQEGFYQ